MELVHRVMRGITKFLCFSWLYIDWTLWAYIIIGICCVWIVIYQIEGMYNYSDRIPDPAEYYRIIDEVEDWKKRHNMRG